MTAATMAANAVSAARANGAANAVAMSVLVRVAPNAAMLMAKPAWRTIMVTAEAMPVRVGGVSARTTLDICGFARAAPTPMVSIPVMVAARRIAGLAETAANTSNASPAAMMPNATTKKRRHPHCVTKRPPISGTNSIGSVAASSATPATSMLTRSPALKNSGK